MQFISRICIHWFHANSVVEQKYFWVDRSGKVQFGSSPYPCCYVGKGDLQHTRSHHHHWSISMFLLVMVANCNVWLFFAHIILTACKGDLYWDHGCNNFEQRRGWFDALLPDVGGGIFLFLELRLPARAWQRWSTKVVVHRWVVHTCWASTCKAILYAASFRYGWRRDHSVWNWDFLIMGHPSSKQESQCSQFGTWHCCQSDCSWGHPPSESTDLFSLGLGTAVRVLIGMITTLESRSQHQHKEQSIKERSPE